MMSALVPVAQEAVDQGIPIIILDTLLEDSELVLTTISSDNYEGGRIAGEALVGVVIAILFVSGFQFEIFGTAPLWPGLLIWIYIAILLAYIPIRIIIKKENA